MRYSPIFESTNFFSSSLRFAGRYLGRVYLAGLWPVNGDTQMAQEVAQVVFTDLARKAASHLHPQRLAGWLYTSTHFAAAKAVRTECGRCQQEREASAMHERIQDPTRYADWQQLGPVLD